MKETVVANQHADPAQARLEDRILRARRQAGIELVIRQTDLPVFANDLALGSDQHGDVAGLCRAATLKEIEAQGWSLNPGRCVGVAAGEAVSDDDFKEQLETLNEELETLTTTSMMRVRPNVGGTSYTSPTFCPASMSPNSDGILGTRVTRPSDQGLGTRVTCPSDQGIGVFPGKHRGMIVDSATRQVMLPAIERATAGMSP